MWIKVPTLVSAVAAFLWLDGLGGVAVAAAITVAGVALVLALVFHPNSNAWARTLWRAPRPIDAVALTFDDGPDPKATREIARILAEWGVPATFFVVGERARAHRDIVARLHEQGHLIANHSDTHGPLFHFSRWSTVRREVRACNEAIASVIGCEPVFFRAPQGLKTPVLGDVLRELHMTAVGWQVRGLDSIGSNARTIAERVLRGARPGGVIMLHDGTGFGGSSERSATIEALPLILERLRERGLRLIRLDELLGVEPYRRVDS